MNHQRRSGNILFNATLQIIAMITPAAMLKFSDKFVRVASK
jgi:hypothetical protein